MKGRLAVDTTNMAYGHGHATLTIPAGVYDYGWATMGFFRRHLVFLPLFFFPLLNMAAAIHSIGSRFPTSQPSAPTPVKVPLSPSSTLHPWRGGSHIKVGAGGRG